MRRGAAVACVSVILASAVGCSVAGMFRFPFGAGQTELFSLNRQMPIREGPGVCTASNANDFKGPNGCLARAKAGSVQMIVVNAMIECNTSTPCAFLIENQNTPLQVVGVDRETTGFHRTAGFADQMFYIRSSTGPVLFSNMTITEGVENHFTVECGDPLDPSQCDSTFHIEGSDLTLESVTIHHSKYFALAVGSSKAFLQDVLITDAALGGIWMGGTSDLKVFNSTIRDVHVGAVFTSGPAITRGAIAGNLIAHNHRFPRYWCGPNIYCPGGQIDFGPNTEKMDAFFNEFIDGYVNDPQYGNQFLGISGVEFQQDDVGMSDIRVIRNRMTNNSGWGVVKNYFPAAPFTNIRIFENVMFQNNPIGVWGNTQACAVNNYTSCLPLGEASCESPTCVWSKPTATLSVAQAQCSGSPETCTLSLKAAFQGVSANQTRLRCSGPGSDSGFVISGSGLTSAAGVNVPWTGSGPVKCTLWHTDTFLQGSAVASLDADIMLLDVVYISR